MASRSGTKNGQLLHVRSELSATHPVQLTRHLTFSLHHQFKAMSRSNLDSTNDMNMEESRRVESRQNFYIKQT